MSKRRQTGLPASIEEQAPEPVFSKGHLPEGRETPLVVDETRRGPFAWLYDKLASIWGQHSQELNNFLFEAPIDVAKQALPYNPRRAYLLIQNRGTDDIFIAFNRQADSQSGVKIPADGNYEPVLGTVSSVSILAATAIQSVVIVEGFYSGVRR